jgi:regulator of sirC expression with transglutaminase-like and TPR domain
MTFETRFTFEKLLLELKLLRNEDFSALVPLAIGVHAVLWPKENVETCFRQIQFMGFEVIKECDGLGEADRFEVLRKFIFQDKAFQVSTGASQDVGESQVLLKCVLDDRRGHPLLVVFIFLYMAHFLDIPIALIQARHHFLLKWVRSGKTLYLDLYNECRPLGDRELIQFLNRSSSNLEVWSAKQLMTQYLELLMSAFESAQNLPQLHVVYNLLLQLDDGNTSILGQRALLRQKLGYTREALSDLKRYFSFVERSHAPNELQQAWLELDAAPEPPPRGPTEVLH